MKITIAKITKELPSGNLEIDTTPEQLATPGDCCVIIENVTGDYSSITKTPKGYVHTLARWDYDGIRTTPTTATLVILEKAVPLMTQKIMNNRIHEYFTKDPSQWELIPFS